MKMFNRKRSMESSVAYGPFFAELLATDEPKLNKMQKFRRFVKNNPQTTVIVGLGFVVAGTALATCILATGGLAIIGGVVYLVVSLGLVTRLAHINA